MEYSNMKRFLSTVLFTMILASPTLAETTTTGGGASLPVQNPRAADHLRYDKAYYAQQWRGDLDIDRQ